MRKHLLSVRFALMLLAVLIFSASSLYAIVHEQWSARFPGPGHSLGASVNVGVDSLGNVYVVQPKKSGPNGWMASKYSPEGVMLWRTIYTCPPDANATANDLAVDAAGNLFVTGYSLHEGQYGGLLTVKYNTNGQLVWSAPFLYPPNFYESGKVIALDGEGNVYVAGSSHYGGGGSQDYITVKYNSQGILQWAAVHSGPNPFSQVVDMAVDELGNVIVTGWNGSAMYAPAEFLTVGYNSLGIEQWSALHSPVYGLDARPCAVAVDDQGDVIVAGYSQLQEYFPIDNYTLIKYNSQGVQQWIQNYPGAIPWSQFRATDMTLDADNNIIITGFADEYDIGFWTVKYNSQGIMQWSRLFPVLFDGTYAGKVVVDAGGNVYLTSGTTGVSGDGLTVECTTIKYNPQGDLKWIATHDVPQLNSNQWGLNLALDRQENVIVSARLDFDLGEENQMLLLKLHQRPGDLAAAMIPSISPVQIPAQGGSFRYNLITVNGVEPNLRTQLWWNVIYPGNDSLVTLDPQQVELPLDSSSVQHTQHVPGNLPAGTYQYVLYAGEYPYMIWATDTIPVTKLSTGDGPWVAGWDNTQETTGEDNGDLHPSSFSLHPCSPNPFNPTTVLSFELRVPSQVSLKVYDTAGRLVTVLVDGWGEAGTHEVRFDGSNIASGIYFYTLTAGSKTITNKMALLK